MATLVLTTVGGAVGGPIGAALGAALGQRVDGALLAPRTRQGPRLSELKLQTSSYGTQVPKVFGRMRVAGCVIWATDLIEQRGTTRGGKGQARVTNYSYAASFAVALSARAIVDVGRIWADGKLLRGAAGDWKVRTGFRLHRGGEDQAPDPLIASAVAGSAAPAHRGMAYAVFEMLQLADYGNRIPSLTFEVIADEGAVRVGDVAREIGRGALVGEGPVDLVHGYAASGDTIAGAAEVLARLCGGWFVARGGGVALANRAGVPVRIAARTLARTRMPMDRVPAQVEVAHYDPARDYQIGVQRAVRARAGGRGEELQVAAALPAADTKAIALSTLLARERMRETRQVVSDARAMMIAPGEAVCLVDDPRVWRVARSSVEAMRVTLDLVPLVHGIAAREADGGTIVASPDVETGRTVVTAFELYPDGDEAWTTPRIAIVAAGDRAGWRQAAIEINRDDGVSWETLGASAAPAVIGTVTAPIARRGAALVDRASVIEVALLHDGMTLHGADAAQLGRGANRVLIGDEVLQFGRAEQVAPGRWRLTQVTRGLNGSEPRAHAAGERFILLERDSLLIVPGGLVRLGDRIRVSARGTADDDAPAIAEAMCTGRSVAPLSPVHLRWLPQSDGGARVTWIRRARTGWAWRDGGDVPLAEEREAYRVTVSSTAGERVLLAATPSASVLAEEVTAGGVRVAVEQLGTSATSPAAIITQGNQA